MALHMTASAVFLLPHEEATTVKLNGAALPGMTAIVTFLYSQDYPVTHEQRTADLCA